MYFLVHVWARLLAYSCKASLARRCEHYSVRAKSQPAVKNKRGYTRQNHYAFDDYVHDVKNDSQSETKTFCSAVVSSSIMTQLNSLNRIKIKSGLHLRHIGTFLFFAYALL